MASECETMGIILGDVARSAVVMSLRDTDGLSARELEEQASRRLEAIGKSLDGTRSLENHLGVLQKRGIVTAMSDKYRLTEVGRKALDRLTSG